MTRRPAAPANLRNGLKWRDGRPYWEPSPANRACGFKGMVLKTAAGDWMDRGAATTAADNRTAWASLVRNAQREDEQGGKARAMLRAALDALPVVPADPHARSLVADLIEHGRAVLETREPDITAALRRAPRTVAAMVDGYFADRDAQSRISAGTAIAYRKQSKKLIARFGDRRVETITRPEIREWYLSVQAAVSTSTANLALGAAGAFFRWATWQNPAWLDTSPTDKVGRDQALGRRVFWTVEEETAFIAWCDGHGYEDVADAVAICLWTGARQIDVTAADLPELEGATWRYVPQKTKRKQIEALPDLLPPVHRRVERRRRHLAENPLRHLNATPFLWDLAKNRRHTSSSIGDRFREARAAAVADKALPTTFLDKRLQDTRDTCVTRLAAADVSFQRICSWGGWAPDSATKILRDHYLSLLDGAAIESAEKLSAWAVTQGLDMAAA